MEIYIMLAIGFALVLLIEAHRESEISKVTFVPVIAAREPRGGCLPQLLVVGLLLAVVLLIAR